MRARKLIPEDFDTPTAAHCAHPSSRPSLTPSMPLPLFPSRARTRRLPPTSPTPLKSMPSVWSGCCRCAAYVYSLSASGPRRARHARAYACVRSCVHAANAHTFRNPCKRGEGRAVRAVRASERVRAAGKRDWHAASSRSSCPFQALTLHPPSDSLSPPPVSPHHGVGSLPCVFCSVEPRLTHTTMAGGLLL